MNYNNINPDAITMRALAFSVAAIVATVSANAGWSNMYYHGHANAENDSPAPNPAQK